VRAKIPAEGLIAKLRQKPALAEIPHEEITRKLTQLNASTRVLK
jgi:hypothetical protein